MRVLGAGDNVADRYLHQAMLYPGGNAVNVAVFAARLGARAGYLGVLGDDAAGRQILRALEAEHVDTALTRVVHAPNATADVELVGNDRVFLRSDRTTALFELDDAQLDAMAAYDVVHSVEDGSRTVVGVNRFRRDADEIYEPLKVDPTIEAQQADRLARLRAERDNAEVDRHLVALRASAEGTDNVLYPMHDALRARATVGEVCNVLRDVWGVHHPTDAF